jgi:hypothetical protein
MSLAVLASGNPFGLAQPVMPSTTAGVPAKMA